MQCAGVLASVGSGLHSRDTVVANRWGGPLVVSGDTVMCSQMELEKVHLDDGEAHEVECRHAAVQNAVRKERYVHISVSRS